MSDLICPKCKQPVTSEQADEVTLCGKTYPVYDCPCGYHLIVADDTVYYLPNLLIMHRYSLTDRLRP